MCPLTDIFDRCFSLIKDTDLAKLSDDDLYKLAKVWYEMSATRFKECKKNLEVIEQNGELYITDDLTLEEKNIIAQGMIVYWLESKVNYNKLMKNQVNTKDWNNLSNANILLRLSELFTAYQKQFLNLRKAYSGRYNDNFEGWN